MTETMQRITIMLDKKTLYKLRQIQAGQISKTNKSVSLSGVINQLLQKATR